MGGRLYRVRALRPAVRVRSDIGWTRPAGGRGWNRTPGPDLPPLKDFILPGGSESAARCHLARTIARRAERRVISLTHNETVKEATIRYLNRLSDLLFVIARVLARRDGGSEVIWVHGDQRP